MSIGEYILGALILCGLGYFSLLLWDVKTEVAGAPRAAMFVCEKHGVFPEKYALEIPTPTTEQPVKVCPFCFEEAEKKARERLGVKTK